ncbi:LysR family transcriptional regulator [Croceicoccus estronivorus]|uniref:LysR family transcriptional regulator n=1 Tax=Croceicoccus estronivorus TaxID=1172626 RepID=UPI0014782EFE|nr:LysR family transcriptional regulator [Croceicoccus estronivorus]
MEWSDLKVFLAAVRTGSYTAAGRRLGINRTTVGRRIDSLENALGVSLFQQTPNGHAPTREGEELLATASLIEMEIDDLMARLEFPGEVPETIRIASSGGIASEFLPELATFQQQEPRAAIELLGELDPLDAVTQRRADLAIALVRVPPVRLTGIHVGALAQAPYARRDSAADRVLGWGHEVETAVPGQWTITNPSGELAEGAGIARFNSWQQLKQAVLAGMGRASLWCFAADAEPTLQQLSEPDPRQDYPLWLLHRTKSPPGPHLRKLVTYLEHALRERLAPVAREGGQA